MLFSRKEIVSLSLRERWHAEGVTERAFLRIGQPSHPPCVGSSPKGRAFLFVIFLTLTTWVPAPPCSPTVVFRADKHGIKGTCDKAVKSNTNGKGQRILRFSILFFASQSRRSDMLSIAQRDITRFTRSDIAPIGRSDMIFALLTSNARSAYH